MCDFNKIAGWLIAAQILYVGMLVGLAIGVFNSGSFWLSALNIPLMVGLIAAAAAATALAALALAEANKCKASACGAAASTLATWLTGFVANLAVVTAALIAAAVLAPIPFAGAVALGVVTIYVLTAGIGLSAVIEIRLAAAATEFSECQARNNAASNSTATAVIWVLSILTAVVVVAITVGGAVSGYVPYGWDSLPPGIGG